MRLIPLIGCVLALALGVALLLTWGLHPPAWLAGLEAAFLAGAALAHGFTGKLPRPPDWLWLKPVKGTAVVCLGIGAMYVPPNLLLSAFLIGSGVRLVWQSACEHAMPEPRIVLWQARETSPVRRAEALPAPSEGDPEWMTS